LVSNFHDAADPTVAGGCSAPDAGNRRRSPKVAERGLRPNWTIPITQHNTLPGGTWGTFRHLAPCARARVGSIAQRCPTCPPDKQSGNAGPLGVQRAGAQPAPPVRSGSPNPPAGAQPHRTHPAGPSADWVTPVSICFAKAGVFQTFAAARTECIVTGTPKCVATNATVVNEARRMGTS
jgi:hypothetical protein